MSCKRNPVDIIKNYKRILVIGDIHSDYSTMRQLFIDAKILDKNLKWICNDTIVVQMGDQLDGGGRGNQEAYGEIEVLDLLENAHNQAQSCGGGVYCLIGNHEFMNFKGDFRYVSEKDMELSGGEESRNEMFSPGGVYAKKLACSRVAIMKIKDLIFVHGGLSPNMIDYIKNDKNIKHINQTLRDFLLKSMDTEEVNRFFTNKDSLLWNRSQGKDNVSCSNFQNIGGIIIGHTPQKTINSKCDKKIWRTDVGISKSMGKINYQILEIKNVSGKNEFNVIDL